jgi:hypothetical protein
MGKVDRKIKRKTRQACKLEESWGRTNNRGKVSSFVGREDY